MVEIWQRWKSNDNNQAEGKERAGRGEEVGSFCPVGCDYPEGCEGQLPIFRLIRILLQEGESMGKEKSDEIVDKQWKSNGERGWEGLERAHTAACNNLDCGR